MVKVITALGEPKLNKELEKENEIQILSKDILYQEGIFEILENKKNIDYIILNNKLYGKYSLNELIINIKKINKKIKIILIVEEKINKKINGINKIFFYNEKDNIINYLKNNFVEENKNTNGKISEKNNIKKNKIKNKKIIGKIIEKIRLTKMTKCIKNLKIVKKNKEKEETKVIIILGTSGVGKTIFSAILGNIIKNKKVLLLDFDTYKKDLTTLLTTKNKSKKNKNNEIKNLIIKINKKLDLISNIELLNLNNNFYKEINKIKKNYNYIIIDTQFNYYNKYLKNYFDTNKKIILLLEANILEIKKAKIIFNKINKKNEKNKIEIIINKYNEKAIDEKIIKNIFNNKIIGKIKYRKNYNLIINNFYKYYGEIKKEYLKILKKI